MKDDMIYFSIKLNFNRIIKRSRSKVPKNYSKVPQCLAKRLILSQVNGIFDPMGLSSPFTVKAKILMRRLWTEDSKRLGWDDAIPKEEQKSWGTIL